MATAGGASEERGINCTNNRLRILHEMIISWDFDQSIIWDRDSEEASQFLMVVDEVRQFTEDLGEEQEEILSHAHEILQMAMARLEDEFIHLLIQYRQLVEPEHVWLYSAKDGSVDDFSDKGSIQSKGQSSSSLAEGPIQSQRQSSSSFDEGSIQSKCQSEITRCSEQFVIDLIQPDVILGLKSIAKMMFLCKYDKECYQAYIAVRKDALDDCLSVLLTQRYSNEELIQMDWHALCTLIERWNRVLKFFIRFYLDSERRLSDLIFGDLSESVRDYCFFESSKGPFLQLLNLGEAIGTGSLKNEKIFQFLDMYEGLTDHLIDIKSLYQGEYGSFILTKCQELLLRLSESLMEICAEFKKAIKNNTSKPAFSGGGVHPLVRYVMNYMKCLADYNEAIDSILHPSSSSMVHLFQSVASILETNLNARSMLYTNGALQNLYMMNNICYMVQKVDDSDLKAIIGDDWIRGYRSKFEQYAISYQRASWKPVLSFLKVGGMSNTGTSGSPSKGVLKERFKGFNRAFEEVYRTQTGWIVPNLELRDDLKISISQNLISAYRTFMGMYGRYLDGGKRRDSYIKHSPQDLETYLLDLFEGVPKAVSPRKR